MLHSNHAIFRQANRTLTHIRHGSFPGAANPDVIETFRRPVGVHGRRLKANPVRVTHPDSHTPMSSALEAVYYPNEDDVVKKLRALVA